MSKPKFVYVTYIKTTPEKLWEALLSPAFTTQYWFDTRWESDWKVGSQCEARTSNGALIVTGKVLESNPPQKLVFSWKHEKANMNQEAPSRVAYELERENDMVKLTVTHDEFPENSVVFAGIQNGWPKVLSNLKTMLETGAVLQMSSACQTAKN